MEREGPLPCPSPEVRRRGEVLRPRALDRPELRGGGRREEVVRGAGGNREGGGVRAGRRAVRTGGAAPGEQGGDIQGVRGPAAAPGQRSFVCERTCGDRGRVPASGSAQAVRERIPRPPSRTGREGPSSLGRRRDPSGLGRLGGPGRPWIPQGGPLSEARAGPFMAPGPADPQGPRPPEGSVVPARARAGAEHRALRGEEARGIPSDLRGRRVSREDEGTACDGEAPCTAADSRQRVPAHATKEDVEASEAVPPPKPRAPPPV